MATVAADAVVWCSNFNMSLLDLSRIQTSTLPSSISEPSGFKHPNNMKQILQMQYNNTNPD